MSYLRTSFFLLSLSLAVALCGCPATVELPPSDPDVGAQPVIEGPEEQPIEPPPLAEEAGPAEERDHPGRTDTEESSQSRELSIQVGQQPEGTAGVELWYTLDDGETWLRDSITMGNPEWIRFSAQRDGRFGFKLVPVDKMGRGAFLPLRGSKPDVSVIVDTQPPIVVLESPNGGNVFRSAGTELIRWSVVDANLPRNSILIEGSSNGGRTWSVIARDIPNDGRYFWRLPSASGQNWRVRVSARDVADNVGSDSSDADFIVDGLPPEGQILGPPTSARSEVEVQYRAGDLGGAGLARVELWASQDQGITWEHVATDDDTFSPLKFHALDGKYLLWLVLVDTVGNSSEPPPRGTPLEKTDLPALIVDTQPPDVRLTSFHDSGIYAGDFEYDITFAVADTNLSANPIKLEYSIDGGMTWREIASGLEAKLPCKWKTPAANVEDCRLRITASDLLGNLATQTTPPFSLDVFVPEALIIGPTRSSKADVEIAYEIQNRGVSPIRSVELWYTIDDGTRWHRYGEDADRRSPFLFKAGDGNYGIAIVCASELGTTVGRTQRRPVDGEKPKHILSIDTSPPLVELTSFKGKEVFKGNSKQALTWTANDPNLDRNCVTLEYSPTSGTAWFDIARNIDNSGRFEWKLPPATASTYRVRVTVRDTFGNIGSAVSADDFGIDSVEPKVIARGPDISSTDTVEVSYTVLEDVGPAGLDEVELWYTNLDAKPRRWERVDSSRAHPATFLMKISDDGRYGIKAIASDRVGNRNIPPATDTKPDFEILVDATKPTVSLKSFNEGGVFAGGRTYEVLWEASDKHLGEAPISIWFSQDSGTNWVLLVNEHQNTGKFQWALPAVTVSDSCMFKVQARDAGGNLGEAVSTKPFSIDVAPPIVHITLAELPGTAVQPDLPPADRRDIEVRYTASDIGKAGVASVQLWATPDGGRTWSPVATATEPSGHFVYQPKDDGVYGFIAIATDNVGNSGRAPAPDDTPTATIMVETQAPVVKLKNFLGGEAYPGGVRLIIAYEAIDANLKADPISIYHSEDGGKTWEVIVENTKNTGYYFWTLPFITCASNRIKVVARDIADKMGSAESESNFVIDSSSPAIFFPTSHTVSRTRKCVIPFQRSGSSCVKLVSATIYFRETAASEWSALPPVPLAADEIEFEAPSDGEFHLYVCTKNEVGNETPKPNASSVPQHTVIVDASPPQVQLVKPAGGEVFPARASLNLEWLVTDDRMSDEPVVIELSSDGGKNWLEIARVPNSGKAELELPSTSGAYLLRVTARDLAGNVGTGQTVESFVVDGIPPVLKAVSMQVAEEFAEIHYEAVDDGGSGLQLVELWFTMQPGRGWVKARDTDADLTSPFLFPLPLEDGIYGIKLVGTDRAGNRSPEPIPGDTPDLTMTLDRKAPSLVLKSLLGGEILRGGSVCEIEWEAHDDYFGEEPIWIELSDDGGTTWKPLAGPLKNTGRMPVSLPAVDGSNYRLRVRAEDLHKNSTAAVSPAPFAIDSSPPFARPEKTVVKSYTANTNVPFVAGDIGAAGLARVDAYLYSFDSKTWRKIGSIHGQTSGSVSIVLETGSYGVTFVGVDNVGLAGTTPVDESHVQGIVNVNLRPPAIKILSPREGEILRGGTMQVVSWSSDTEVAKAGGVTLEFSLDDGITWTPVESGLDNTGVYQWQVPQVPRSSTCRLRVTLEDQYERVGTAVSAKFSIVSSAPKSKISFGDRRTQPEVADVDDTTGAGDAQPLTEAELARRRRFDQAMYMGNQFYHSRDFVRACSYYRQAVEIEPNSVVARHRLGMSLFHDGKPLAAIEELEKALKLAPNNVDLRNDLGGVLLTQNKFDAAREHFLHILKLDEKNALARFNLATLLLREKKEDEAIAEFKKAIDADPKLQRAFIAIADIQRKRGQMKEARENLKKAIEANPDSADAEHARRMLTELQ